MRFGNLFVGAVLLAGIFGVASGAKAESVLFSGDNGGSLAAQALFSLSGSTLTITLTNTSTVATTNSSQVLTALFWTDSTAIGGSFSSAAIPSGSSVVPSTATQAGEDSFGYVTDAHNVYNSEYALSAADFANTNSPPSAPITFDKALNLLGVSGGQLFAQNGGLVPTANGNSAGGSSSPVIENSIVYTITGTSLTSLSGINAVNFQYADNLTTGANFQSDVRTNVVPLPASVAGGLVLLGGMAGFGLFRKRFSSKLA